VRKKILSSRIPPTSYAGRGERGKNCLPSCVHSSWRSIKRGFTHKKKKKRREGGRGTYSISTNHDGEKGERKKRSKKLISLLSPIVKEMCDSLRERKDENEANADFSQQNKRGRGLGGSLNCSQGEAGGGKKKKKKRKSTLLPLVASRRKGKRNPSCSVGEPCAEREPGLSSPSYTGKGKREGEENFMGPVSPGEKDARERKKRKRRELISFSVLKERKKKGEERHRARCAGTYKLEPT